MPLLVPKQKWKRRLLWIGGSLLILIGVISFTADGIIERVMRAALNKTELTFYGIEYRLDVQNISTSILRRSVILEKVHFFPIDTTVLDQTKDTVQLMISFGNLRLGGMDLRQILKGDSLGIGSIKVKNAEVEVFVNIDKLDPNNVQFVPDVKELFARNSIGHLEARNAIIKVKIRDRGINYRTIVEPTDIRIEQPHTQAPDSEGIKRFTFYHLELQAEKVLADLDDGNEFTSSTFSINSTDSTIHISELNYGPRNGTPKVDKGEIKTINWTKVTALNLQIQGVELLRLLHGDGFHALEVRLDEPHISTYQSFFIEDSIKTHKATRLPGPTIKNWKRRFHIQHLELNNGMIEYEEVYDTISDPIYFVVRDMDLSLDNFTPRPELLKENDVLKVGFSATLLDSVHLRAHLDIPILSSNGTFFATGHLDPLEFSIFNPFILSSKMKFKSGHLNSMEFEFTADQDRSTGNLYMDYTNLHIQLLKNKKLIPLRLTKHNVLTSFLFNKFVKSNNNREASDFRAGVIDVQRDPNADILVYLYENIVAGMISSMSGIDDSMSNRFSELESSKSKKELRQEKKQKKRDRKKKK